MMSMMPGVSVWYHVDRISRITSAGVSFDALGKCIIDLSLLSLLKNTEPATGNQPGAYQTRAPPSWCWTESERWVKVACLSIWWQWSFPLRRKIACSSGERGKGRTGARFCSMK